MIPDTIFSYYRDDADRPLIEAESMLQLKEYDIAQLTCDEARNVSFDPLFDLHEYKTNSHALPKTERQYIILPGSRTDHGWIKFEDKSLRSLVEDWINEYCRGMKYILYNGRSDFYAFRATAFSYNILNFITSGYNISSFVVFDEHGEQQVTFDDDLEITMFMSSRVEGPPPLLGKTTEYWNKFFKDNFPQIIQPHQTHIDVFNELFAPRLPGIGRLDFPPGRKVIPRPE